MTTTPTSSQERPPQGRTVRDIVERSPGLVNEVWCRKILRQLLASLEAQYADDAPHRLIMPDTIVIQPNGDTLLLPDPDANSDFHPEPAADLRALAAVIHYAITQEMPPAGPLLGRALEGYSDSLLGAVDRCMAPVKTQRPQTVAQLRDLLGMVSVGLLKPSVAAAAEPAPATVPALQEVIAPAIAARRANRLWLWLGLAFVLLAAALFVMREHGAELLVTPKLTPPVSAALPAPAPAAVAVPVPAQPAPAAAEPAVQPPLVTSAPVTKKADQPAAPAQPAPSAIGPADAAVYAAETAQDDPAKEAISTVTTYRLLIKPWGNVYVDGKKRGVSPPLKRLVLPAGQHTVRIENPGFPDRLIRLDTSHPGSTQITHDFPAASRLTER